MISRTKIAIALLAESSNSPKEGDRRRESEQPVILKMLKDAYPLLERFAEVGGGI